MAIAPRHLWSSVAAMTLVACGQASDGAPAAAPASAMTAAPTPDIVPTSPETSTAARTAAPASPTITAIDEGATVSEPAERLDDDIVVTWIGGSDLELQGRSLPRAVAPLLTDVGGRAVLLDVDTVQAPLPADVAVSVERAVARNTDALVISMSPSWVAWDGHDECDGITPAHDFYLCVLTPRTSTDVAALEADLAAMVETVAASGTPAYVYAIPHSADALANPTLERRLAEAELVFARVAPTVDRVDYFPMIPTRGRADLREGVEFFDMVHPTEAGIDLLAEFFADELERFLGERVLD